MRASKELPWWFQDIIGFEGEDDSAEETEEEEDEKSEDDSDDSSDHEEDESDEDEDDEEGEKPKKKSDKPDIDGLKSALRKERIERKKLQREIARLKKPVPEPPKKKDDEKPAEKDESPPKSDNGVSEKLAAKLLTNAVDTAIIRYAGADFVDVGDMLRLIDRSEIDVDQNEDDPSEIEVDAESVQDAIKALRKSKPYLVKVAKGDQATSGSKFGGKKKNKTELTEEQLRKKYPALRR